MLTDDQRRLARAILVSEPSIADATTRHSVAELDLSELLRDYLAEKAELGPTSVSARINSGAQINRDKRGVPHIRADDPYDLFFAHGYAQAQDRLWQLDFLRRQAHGRLAKILGPDRLESDILSETIGISEISRRAFDVSHAESRDAFQAFADGVNAWMNDLPVGLPVEFELLDYAPEPWIPVDSIAIMRRWYWYLTGRLPVISTPEAVRAGIGDREAAFFQPDGKTEYIVQAGDYSPDPTWPDLTAAEGVEVFWGSVDGVGSNNWAVGPELSASGHAMVGSDPHVYYTVPADWYDVHLHGAGYDVIGMTYPGVPMIRFGRNRSMAWGITNNICLQRDLYVERMAPDDPETYLDGDTWKPIEHLARGIPVRGESPFQLDLRFAHGRPVVDHLVAEAALPRNLWGEARGANTCLSLAWVGFDSSDEPKALLDLGRAATVADARRALSTWRCPTWNFVLADSAGSFGYQCSGAIPLRGREHRGYRDGNDPIDAWQGYIPFEGMPRAENPPRGWVASSNNPTAPPDFPYPLYGTWAVEDRAARAVELLQVHVPHTVETFKEMQNDVFSGRASRGAPALVSIIDERGGADLAPVAEALRSWDYGLDIESTGGAIFYVFFWRWHQHVVRHRFDERLVPLVQDAGWGLSSSLILENDSNWFDSDDQRMSVALLALTEALAWLSDRLGNDLASWKWGDIHRLGATHPAAQTPLQHDLLDMPLRPHPGGAGTLSSAFYAPAGSFDNKIGASYRIVSVLDDDAETHSITWPGHSGHPGSPHYSDQVDLHRAGEYMNIPFLWRDVEQNTTFRQNLVPDRGSNQENMGAHG